MVDYVRAALYSVVKGLAVCIAGMRNQHGQCPKEVVQFLLDLFKYNDNQYNKVRCGIQLWFEVTVWPRFVYTCILYGHTCSLFH